MRHLRVYETFNDNVKSSVVIIENIYNNILILKRGLKSRQQGWCLPGGRIDEGELAIDAAKREVFEETGIKIKKSNLKYIGYELSVRGFYVSIYHIKINKTPKIKLSDEHTDFQWVKEYYDLDLAGNTGMYIDKIKKL